MPNWGKKSLRAKLTPSQQASADWVVPWMNSAVKTAEGNPRNFGVLSVQTNNPNQVLNNSIFNNYARWLTDQQNKKPFVDYMGNRWAPQGVANDPTNLNKNWIPNVKASLLKMLGPDEYMRWKQYNMVQAPGLNNNDVVV